MLQPAQGILTLPLFLPVLAFALPLFLPVLAFALPPNILRGGQYVAVSGSLSPLRHRYLR